MAHAPFDAIVLFTETAPKLLNSSNVASGGKSHPWTDASLGANF